MLVANYDRWLESKAKELAENIAAGEEAPVFKCAQCLGDGTIMDTGEITGEEFEAKCNKCDGIGKVDFEQGDINKRELRALLPYHEYQKEVLKDLRQLARYTSRPEWIVLSDNGWEVFSEVNTKKLVVKSPRDGVGRFYCEKKEVIH